MKNIFFIIWLLIVLTNQSLAQVRTNFNNETVISNKGKFKKNYRRSIEFIIPPKNIDSLLNIEKLEIQENIQTKPFKLAVATPVDLDIFKLMRWTYSNDFA